MLSGLKPHGIRANDLADTCHDPAFAAHIAGDTGILALPPHLVDFIDEDDAAWTLGSVFQVQG